MFKRGSAAAFAVTVALPTVHFGSPSSAAPSGITVVGASARQEAVPKVSYAGGCSAYFASEGGKPHTEPEDENAGSATTVIDSFFSLDAGKNPPLPSTVRYAIALTPDPRHTNLSVMFDREMALLVQAAQDQGYDYNSSWIPWSSDSSPALTHLGERQYADDLGSQRESCPGVILFRRRNQSGAETFSKGLVVLVVGEQATGGINQGQWWNALLWLSQHAGLTAPLPHADKTQAKPIAGDGVLRILGPTFTGSLPSLRRNLKALYDPDAPQPGGAPAPPANLRDWFPIARILSGSVSSCSAVQWFERELPRGAQGSSPWHIDFGTFQENDSVHIYRLMKFLSSQGTSPSDTAILSEDETAYAAREKTDSPCDFPYAQDNRPIHLVFPRDISALRNAYERQEVFAGSGPGLKERAHPILHGDAPGDTDQSEITDTIASSNGAVAAIDQEAYLYGLVSILRTHHARYLILRCTNPLDFLFLTRFFHRAYPQARIVTVGSDLLFRREIDTTEFRGVLSITSYPLLPRSQHWSRITEDKWDEQNHNHLVFQGDIAEGMYFAARYTLQGANLPSPNSDPQTDQSSDVPLIPAQQAPPECLDMTGPCPALRMYRAFPAPDFSDPFWFHPETTVKNDFATHPPTWISAVGRDGYWPIAVIKRDQIAGVCLEDENNHCSIGSPAKAPPVSTVLDLIEPDPAELAKLPDPKTPTSALVQHYEFKRASTSGQPRILNSRLRISLPLPWIIAALLASALLGYQVWGLIQGGINPADGLFSVFRLSEDPAHGVLLAVGCSLSLMLLFELGGVSFVPPDFSLVSGSRAYIYTVFTTLFVAVVLLIVWFVRRKRRLDGLGLPPAAGSLIRTLGTLAASCTVFFLLFWFCYLSRLDEVNAVPRFYRMVHITDGVSPLLPVLLLTFGFYLWNWQAVAGDLMLARGCPTLPRLRNEHAVEGGWYQIGPFGRTFFSQPAAGDGPNTLEPENNHISQTVGREILRLAHPFCFSNRIIAVPIFFFIATCVCFNWTHNLPLLGLESSCFNIVVDGILILALLFTATEALRLYSTWVMLRKLLLALGRLRLLRTICRLRPIEAGSIWSVSGSVRRVQYDLLRDQLDAANRLILLTDATPEGAGPFTYLQKAAIYGKEFARHIESPVVGEVAWNSHLTPPAPMPVEEPAQILPSLMLRDVLADAVGEVSNVLTQIWCTETESINIEGLGTGGEENPKMIPLSDDPQIRAAEEFVAYHYISFIQNIVARMRTMTLSMIFLFITVCSAISFYPFVPRTEVSVWLILNLVLIGSAVAYVYAGMERDEILSYIASTTPGRLGTDFYVRLATFLAGPLIGVLTTQFPSITDTALQWLQPGLDAIK
ncbi:hypothetical protein HDF16_001435 [Granulicella aggregans]|uniref:Uncharacterized protein n=1 Tax=Granulicella aggregans TaxID=474949 RepID=A0A7W8E431_9BACT|nr:hypothetical protein [Granulicella aggregans]MBB5056750.1 hypothetical protein [Granulicella aggregans]